MGLAGIGLAGPALAGPALAGVGAGAGAAQAAKAFQGNAMLSFPGSAASAMNPPRPAQSASPEQGTQDEGFWDWVAQNLGAQNPWRGVARFGQSLNVGVSPPQYGPMSFNRSPANPYIGPGLSGLQLLSLGGGYR